MTGYGVVNHYRKLLVSPHTLRPGITKLIRREIDQHKKHGNGHIIIKCNQLVDYEMVKVLYEASRAGVKIECIVRGICSLRPGLPAFPIRSRFARLSDVSWSMPASTISTITGMKRCTSAVPT